MDYELVEMCWNPWITSEKDQCFLVQITKNLQQMFQIAAFCLESKNSLLAAWLVKYREYLIQRQNYEREMIFDVH